MSFQAGEVMIKIRENTAVIPQEVEPLLPPTQEKMLDLDDFGSTGHPPVLSRATMSAIVGRLSGLSCQHFRAISHITS